VLGGAFACFAGVGGEEFRDVLWLFERDLPCEDAGEEVGECFSVAFGEGGDGKVPEVVGGAGEIVALHDGGTALAKLDELELVVVGNEAETVFTQIAADLL
jgi:hypothetical protein